MPKKIKQDGKDPPLHPVYGYVICGAINRQTGTPCTQRPIKGKARCRMHGGMVPTKKENPKVGAPLGSANAAKPGGLYSKYYTEEELAMERDMLTGDLTKEIALARIQLRRFVNAQNKQIQEIEQGISDGLYLDAMTDNEGGGPNIAAIVKQYKFRDYSSEVHRWTARVESLEKSHKELTKGEDDNPGKITVVVKRAKKQSAEPED